MKKLQTRYVVTLCFYYFQNKLVYENPHEHLSFFLCVFFSSTMGRKLLKNERDLLMSSIFRAAFGIPKESTPELASLITAYGQSLYDEHVRTLHYLMRAAPEWRKQFTTLLQLGGKAQMATLFSFVKKTPTLQIINRRIEELRLPKEKRARKTSNIPPRPNKRTKRSSSSSQSQSDPLRDSHLSISEMIDLENAHELLPFKTKEDWMKYLESVMKIARARLSTSPTSTMEYACCVCDLLVILDEAKVFHVNDEFFKKPKVIEGFKILEGGEWLEEVHPKLIAQYRIIPEDCRDHNLQLFRNALLSPRGFRNQELLICNVCQKFLLKGALPPYAIANLNLVGSLFDYPPHLRDTSDMEIRLVSRQITKAKLEVIRDSSRNKTGDRLLSHSRIYDVNLGGCAKKLPNLAALDSIQVVTTFSIDKMKKYQDKIPFLKVRPSHVLDLILKLGASRPDYEDIFDEESMAILKERFKDSEYADDQIFDIDEDESARNEEENLSYDCHSDLLLNPNDDTELDDGEVELQTRSFVEVPENNYPSFPESSSSSSSSFESPAGHFEQVDSLAPSPPDGQPPRFAQQLGQPSDPKTKYLLEDTFALLFPYRRGGIHEDRKKYGTYLSPQAVIQRLLRVSTRQFQTKLFVAHCFDMLSQDKGRKIACLHLKPEMYGSVAKIPPDEFNQALKIFFARRSKAKGGGGGNEQHCSNNPSTVNEEQSLNVTSTLRLLKTCEMACEKMWNTERERLSYRKPIYAMMDTFGLPQLFVTISPYDSNQPILFHNTQQFSGFDFSKPIRPIDLSLGSKKDRLSAVAENPVAQYFWYSRLMKVFEEVILGFDRKTGRCTKKGGVFGRVKAFCGCTEDQQRGTLHEHMLIWVVGGARTHHEMNALLASNEEWKRQLQILRDQALTTSYQCSSKLQCPNCFSKNLKPISPPQIARTKGAGEPNLISCVDCDSEHQESFLVKEVLKRNAPKSYTMYEEDRELFLFHLRNEGCYSPRFQPDDPSAVLSLAQLICSTHNPNHTMTCFKTKSLNQRKSLLECRFNYPKPTMKEETYRFLVMTTVNPLEVGEKGDSGSFQCLGSAYVNGHSLWILEVFGTNNDVKFLFDPGVVYYICRYPFKSQENLLLRAEDRLAIEQAHLSRLRRLESPENAHLTSTEMGRGNAILFTQMFSQNTKTSLGLGVKYIFDNQCLTSSHTKFTTIGRQQTLARVRGEDPPLFLSDLSSRGVFQRAFPPIDDYLNRGEELIDWPYYLVQALYEKKCLTEEQLAQIALRGQLEEENIVEIDDDSLENEVDCVDEDETEEFETEIEEERPSKVLPDDKVTVPECTVIKTLLSYAGLLRRNLKLYKIVPLGESHPQSSTHGFVLRSKGSQIKLVPDITIPRRFLPRFYRCSNIEEGGDWEKFEKQCQEQELDEEEIEEENNENENEDEGAEEEEFFQYGLGVFSPWHHSSSESFVTGNLGSIFWTWLSGTSFSARLARCILENKATQRYTREKAKEALKETLKRLREKGEEHTEGDDPLEILGSSDDNDNEVDARLLGELDSDNSDDSAPPDWLVEICNGAPRRNERIEDYSRGITQVEAERWSAQIKSRKNRVHNEHSTFDFSQTEKADAKLFPIGGDGASRSPIFEQIYSAISSAQEGGSSHPDLQPSQPRHEAFDKPRPKISEISEAFGLDPQQKAAFVFGSIMLLRGKARDLLSENEFESLTPIIEKISSSKNLILHGPGGSGKSFVIRSLRHFAKLWAMSSKLLLCAPTGIAAVLLSGSTYHSALSLNPNNGNIRDNITTEQIDRFRDLEVMIIDEVSMVGSQQDENINVALQKLRGCTTERYGGVSIIYCGDFLQLAPVGSTPMYKPPQPPSRRVIGQSNLPIRNEEYVRRFPHAVCLERNHRAGGQDQKQYAEMLREFRFGRVSKRSLEVLNRRVCPDKLEEFDRKGDWYITAYKRNADRWADLNRRYKIACLLASQGKGPRVYQIPAKITQPKNAHKIDQRRFELKFSLYCRDDDLKFLCPLLYVSVGMHVLVTHNMSAEYGIANGTLGVVVGFAWPAEALDEDGNVKGEYVNFPGEPGVKVFRPFQPPTSILIKPLLKEALEALRSSPFEGLPDDVFPLETKNSVSVQATSPRFRHDLRAQLRGSMTQFPLICADALTIHKLQGQTLDCPLYLPSWRGMSRAESYVTVSRCRKIENLFFGEELSRTMCNNWKVDEFLSKELNRLKTASNSLVKGILRNKN